MGFRFVRYLVRVILALIARVEIIGLENLPAQGAYLATGNHAGRLEVLLIYSIIERTDIILMIAEKYRKSAIWRWFARRVDGIFIDRYNADLSALRQVLRRLEQGGVLAMAPEGTRSTTGTLQPAQPGAAYLAAKSGVPVVPVGVIGTWDQEVVQNLKKLKRIKVTLRIGQAYSLPPLKNQDRQSQLQQYTEEIMCQIAALLPAERRGYYAEHPRLFEILKTKNNST